MPPFDHKRRGLELSQYRPKFKKKSLLSKLDWFGIYSDHLNRWAERGLEIERVKFDDAVDDPIPFRIQISCYSQSASRRIFGYGESMRENDAYEKAICELIEREALFDHGEKLNLLSTNGLACHRWRFLAKAYAKAELYERDAFLRHWLTKKPLLNTDFAGDPLVKKFENSIVEAGHKLFLSETYLGYLTVSIATIVNPSTGGFLIGSSGSSSPKFRQRKAVGEAYLSLFNRRKGGSVKWEIPSFENHANYWYFHKSIPDWFLGNSRQNFFPKINRNPSVTYHCLTNLKPIVIAARSNDLFDLWLGHPGVEILDRVKNFYGISGNTDAHPFP